MTISELVAWGVPHTMCIPVGWLAGVFFAAHIITVWAYYSVPASLQIIARRVPKNEAVQRAATLFSRFIRACGITHLMAALTLFFPVYGVEAAALVWCAGVSAYVAFQFAWNIRPMLSKFISAFDELQRMDNIQADLDRHRRSFMDAPIGILHVDEDGRMIEANHTFARWMHTDADWLMGRQFVDFLHPDDVQRTLAVFSTLLIDGSAASNDKLPFENRYVARDGEIITLRWLSGSGNPVGDCAHVAFCVMLEAAGGGTRTPVDGL